MSPLRRARNSEPAAEQPIEVETEAGGSAESATSGKGRPTPKRRTSSRPAPPAPKTRKEAAAWQKQHGSRARVGGQKKMTNTEYRQALRSGDPSVLPKRDQGPLRALARDYVDSRRMASNYLLWLFPLYLIALLAHGVARYLQTLVLVVFVLFLLEWVMTGSRIRKLAAQRGIAATEGSVAIGFYAGSRAYLRRKWRRPQPRVELGDKF